jgi:hypothetical protein
MNLNAEVDSEKTTAYNGREALENQADPDKSQGSIDPSDDPEAKVTHEGDPVLEKDEKKAYRTALQALNRSGVPYAVGATFARHAYTGIWRQTKDLDLFVKPEDLKDALDALRKADFVTEVIAEHWLAKAYQGNYAIDVIFGNGHGYHPLDERAFEGSQPAKVLGVPTRLIPIEEMIASIVYVAERRRFDGGEVIHLIKCSQGKLDWQRIIDRLGEHRELLLWHLILFDFVYPGDSRYLPKDLMVQLFEERRQEWSKPGKKPKISRGPLLDPFLFTVDINDWGYEDPRNLEPLVNEKGEPR